MLTFKKIYLPGFLFAPLFLIAAFVLSPGTNSNAWAQERLQTAADSLTTDLNPAVGGETSLPVSENQPAALTSLEAKTPVETRSVAELIRELVQYIPKKKVSLRTPPLVFPATPATTSAQTGNVLQPGIATLPNADQRTVIDAGSGIFQPPVPKPPVPPKVEIEKTPTLRTLEPIVPPIEIERIVENIPTSRPIQTELKKEIAKVTERIKAEEPGSDEEAAALIQKLKEYTFNPYVISGARLPAMKSRLSDIPANVSIITKEELKARGPKTIQEAISLLEGVVLYDQIGNGFEQTLGLRGFETGTEVAVIVDGVRWNEPDGGVVNYSLINIDDVEEIEVVRGSYSSAYGNSAFGGVINITTKQPEERKFVPFGTFESGTNKRFYQHGGASGTIPDMLTGMDGDVKYVFSAGRKLDDHFRSNSEIRTTSFLQKIGYELPDEMAGVQFQLNYADNAMSNPGELTVEQFQHTPEISTKPIDGRKFENIVLQVDSHIRLHEQVNLRMNAYRRVEDIDFTNSSITFGSFANTNSLITTKAFTTTVDYEQKVAFISNKLEVGMEYRREKQNDKSREANVDGSVTPFGPFGRPGSQGTDLDTGGIFLSNTTDWTEFVTTVFSIRHDDIGYRFDVGQAQQNGNGVLNFDDTTLRAGLILHPFEHVDVYGNFSEGFKAPSITEVFGFPPYGGVNAGLEPEEANNYEVGMRLRETKRVSANLSFFRIDVKNQILFDSTAGRPLEISPGFSLPEGQNVNVGEARRYGIELSTKIKLKEWLSLFSTYTYTKANIRSTFDLFGTGEFQSGDHIGLVPYHKFTAGVDIEPLKNLHLHLNAVYAGEQKSQSAESLTITSPFAGGPGGRAIDSVLDGYLVFNGRISYTWKDIEIFLQLSNLFDREYYSRAITASGAIPYRYFVTPGQDREISFGTKVKFG